MVSIPSGKSLKKKPLRKYQNQISPLQCLDHYLFLGLSQLPSERVRCKAYVKSWIRSFINMVEKVRLPVLQMAVCQALSSRESIAWVHYGEPEEVKANTTIVMCGVHGDEITPVKFCYDLMRYLDKNQDLLSGNRIIVAPLVTPDSFLKNGHQELTRARG